jgi:hypothetical protein
LVQIPLGGSETIKVQGIHPKPRLSLAGMLVNSDDGFIAQAGTGMNAMADERDFIAAHPDTTIEIAPWWGCPLPRHGERGNKQQEDKR